MVHIKQTALLWVCTTRLCEREMDGNFFGVKEVTGVRFFFRKEPLDEQV